MTERDAAGQWLRRLDAISYQATIVFHDRAPGPPMAIGRLVKFLLGDGPEYYDVLLQVP